MKKRGTKQAMRLSQCPWENCDKFSGLSRHRRSHRGAQEFSLGVCNEGVPGQPTAGSHLESHGSEYGGLVYRSRVDELDAVAAQHAANQPANQPDFFDFQLHSNVHAVSNQHLEAGSFSHTQSGISGTSYQPALPDVFSDLASAHFVSNPSRGSLGRFPAVEYGQRYNTFGVFDLTHAIPVQDLSGQGHLTSRLNNSATALNPLPWLRQAEPSNQDSALSADMPITSQEASDGAQPFFNSLSNTNSTADWEDDTNNAGFPLIITSPTPTQISDIETQTYPFYGMGLPRTDHGAPQMEMPGTAPGGPFLVCDGPKDDSEDPFTIFPPADSWTEAVSRQNWSNV